MMTDIEKQFNDDMMHIYVTAKKELGYNATRFLQMISKYGGLSTAHKLIATEGGTEGFTKLWEYGRLDLSVEAHVLKPEYEVLFSEEERNMCRERLKSYGWSNA